MKNYLIVGHKRYWREVVKSHRQDYATLKKILMNDRGALGVVAALLLATNLASVSSSANVEDFGFILSLLHVIFHLFSAMSALVCIWLGMEQYLKLNMLTPEAAFQYKNEMKWYEEPVAYLNSSLATLPLGLVCGVFLVHGARIGWVSLYLVSVFYLIGIVLVIISEIKSQKATASCEHDAAH